jgi:hypothetical protein
MALYDILMQKNRNIFDESLLAVDPYKAVSRHWIMFSRGMRKRNSINSTLLVLVRQHR